MSSPGAARVRRTTWACTPSASWARALPVVDLNGAGAGIGFHHELHRGRRAGAGHGCGRATLGDPDGGNLRTLTVLITNLLDGADETLDADVSGTSIVKAYAAGVLTLTGPDSLADFQQVLRTVTYDNASQAPTTVDRILRFVPKDVSGLDGASAYATVGVSAVNDAPVIAAPVSDRHRRGHDAGVLDGDGQRREHRRRRPRCADRGDALGG